MEKTVLSESRKRIARIIFNVAIILFVGLGVAIFLAAMDAATLLSTFTIQSNLLSLVAAGITLAYELLKIAPEGKPYILFKGMTLTAILLTFFIYNFVLAPSFNNAPSQSQRISLGNTLLHTAVPLMVFGDYLFFGKKGCFKIWHPFVWTVLPIGYVGYTAIYKAFGGVYKFSGDAVAQFPYFFLDYETYGLQTVGIWCLLIAIGFIGFSFLLFGIDRMFVKIAAKHGGVARSNHPRGAGY